MWRFLPLMAGLLLLGFQDPAPFPENLKRDAIEALKASTVLVEVRGSGFNSTGSGFLISPDGYIITNKHVVQSNRPGTPEISVVLQSGTPSQKRVKVQKSFTSADSDLALLKIEESNLTHVTMGNAADLTETVTLWAFGFPMGNLFQEGQKGPEISINKGSVTALRKSEAGALEFIQIDTQVNPGNSGGPLVAGDGRVYGVITFGIRDSSLRFAIPTSSVNRFLDPQIVGQSSTPGRITMSGGKIEFQAQVLETALKAGEVELVINVGGSPQRLPLTRGETTKGVSTWKGSWDCPPLSAPDLEQMDVNVLFKDKTSRALSYAGNAIALKTSAGVQEIPVEDGLQIRMGENGGADTVITSKGPLEGRLQITGLDSDSGSVSMALVSSARFAKVSRPFLVYRPVVKSGGRTVQGPSSRLHIARPESGDLPRKAPDWTLSEMVEKKLPGRIDSVKLCGGGRYLLLHLKSLASLVVFNVRTLDAVKYIPLLDGEVLFAGGRRLLLICYPESSRLERWDLDTLAREVVVETPFQGTATNLEMGWDSEGPAIAMVRFLKGDSPQLQLFDPLKLRLLDLSGRTGSLRDEVHIRVTAGGTVFCWWSKRSTSTFGVMRIEEKRLVPSHANTSGTYLVPSEDGSLAFSSTGIGEVLESSSRIPSRANPPSPVLPAVEGPFYLELHIPGIPNRGDEVIRGTIHLLSNRTKVASLEVPLLDQWSQYGTEAELTSDRRFWLFPTEKVLITIPSTNDRLVCRPVDVEDLLDRSNAEYLYVASRPPAGAKVGEKWSYDLNIRSKAGSVKVKAESLPEGMTLESNRECRWTPKQQGPATVILRISDASGQEVYHSFRISVR